MLHMDDANYNIDLTLFYFIFWCRNNKTGLGILISSFITSLEFHSEHNMGLVGDSESI